MDPFLAAAASDLKRTSPSPRVVSSESDDDVPEVSYPSQPKVAVPRGDVVEATGDDLRGVLEAEAGGFATFDDDPSGLLGLRRIDTAETTLVEAHPWSFERPSLSSETRQVTPDASPRPVFFACSAPAAPPLPSVASLPFVPLPGLAAGPTPPEMARALPTAGPYAFDAPDACLFPDGTFDALLGGAAAPAPSPRAGQGRGKKRLPPRPAPKPSSSSSNGRPGWIGAYSPEARKRRIARFHGKRARRVWTKRVKYDVRKNFAETRLRVKGRFVKKEEEDLLKDLVGVV